MVEYPLSGGLKGEGNGNFLTALWDFVDEHRLGHVFGDGLGYVIARRPDSVRILGVTFVPRRRFAETGIPECFCPIAPELAVEIVPPTDDPDAARERVEACVGAGTRLAWIAFIATRSIKIVGAEGVIGELDQDDVLDGGEVLPEFRAHVARIFGVNE